METFLLIIQAILLFAPLIHTAEEFEGTVEIELILVISNLLLGCSQMAIARLTVFSRNDGMILSQICNFLLKLNLKKVTKD
jgi:hypothetical protein